MQEKHFDRVFDALGDSFETAQPKMKKLEKKIARDFEDAPLAVREKVTTPTATDLENMRAFAQTLKRLGRSKREIRNEVCEKYNVTIVKNWSDILN